MKKQHNDLIQFLMSQNYPLSSLELANHFNVSSRSIKNYVREINSKYQNNIIIASHHGYEINKKISSILHITSTETIPQTDEERSFYIIKQFILEYKSDIDLFELCDYLSLGYSTIKTLISKMNKMYATYNVKFICKNDYLQIIGNDKNLRQLISYVISEESKVHFLNPHKLKDYFKSIDIDSLNRIILSTFKKHHYYLNDFSMINLLLHLSIIIDRKINDICVETIHSQLQIKDIHEKKLTDELFQLLEEEFLIHFNESEKFEIYLLFKSNTYTYTDKELKTIINDEIVDLTNYYVKQIYNLYMVDLSNKSFTTPLSLHIRNLVFRAQNNNLIKNPMTNTIKYNNPTIFDIATFIGIDLMERYNIYINEEEIAFLAIHIGAEIEKQNVDKFKIPVILFSSNYHDMSSTLSNHLLSNFGNQINIIANINNKLDLLNALTYINEFEPIIIFTTIHLENLKNCTIIEISPFNISNQYLIIQDTIIRHQHKYNNYNFKKNFHNFFESDLFISDDLINTRKEVLTYLCNQLLSKKYVHKSFYDKVYLRENAATTAFDNIAIPHSVDMDAIKTSVAVVISKKGIQWGKKKVYIVFLIAINKADRKVFKDLYEFIISLCNKIDIIEKIRNCSSFNDFEQIIYDNLY